MRPRKTYTLDEVEEISGRLNALKDESHLNRRVSASKAISTMSQDILDLQERGFTIAEIASLLNESGLPVSLATLKSALSRTQKRDTIKARSVPGSVKGPTTAHRSTEEDSVAAARSDGGGFTHIEDSEVI